MKKKIALMATSLVLVVAMAVGGTLAWLTSNAGTVTNTFTVGNLNITLDETDVNEYGVKDGDTRVQANSYKLIPSHTYIKDPTVHVQPGSEACYVFIYVDDQIAALEAETTVADQISANGWTAVSGETKYYYKEQAAVGESAAAVDLKIFENFTLKDDAAVANYGGKTIVIKACAVQSDGLSVTEAFAEAQWS